MFDLVSFSFQVWSYFLLTQSEQERNFFMKHRVKGETIQLGICTPDTPFGAVSVRQPRECSK